MCGIAGICYRGGDESHWKNAVQRMLGAMEERGPDGEGIFVDSRGGAILGHRRLSIIDLLTGDQPMQNEDGSIVITFNGEIYNFQELRANLLQRGHIFRSHSDTEVILHLYEEKEEECIHSLRGEFAFGIWDARKRRLLLARDRMGQKPLYYVEGPDYLAFARVDGWRIEGGGD